MPRTQEGMEWGARPGGGWSFQDCEPRVRTASPGIRIKSTLSNCQRNQGDSAFPPRPLHTGYRVFAVDLLGFGGSDKVKAGVDYELELWRDLLVDFMQVKFDTGSDVWMNVFVEVSLSIYRYTCSDFSLYIYIHTILARIWGHEYSLKSNYLTSMFGQVCVECGISAGGAPPTGRRTCLVRAGLMCSGFI